MYLHRYRLVILSVLPLVQNRCKRSSCFCFVFFMCFTSREPSPKIEVRIGVENMVMMVNKTATPAVMENIN